MNIQDKCMKTTKYLYGVDLQFLSDMRYFDALKYKLDSAKKLYWKLYEEAGDPIRMFHIEKAMNHTQQLIDEKDEMCLVDKE